MFDLTHAPSDLHGDACVRPRAFPESLHAEMAEAFPDRHGDYTPAEEQEMYDQYIANLGAAVAFKAALAGTARVSVKASNAIDGHAAQWDERLSVRYCCNPTEKTVDILDVRDSRGVDYWPHVTDADWQRIEVACIEHCILGENEGPRPTPPAGSPMFPKLQTWRDDELTAAIGMVDANDGEFHLDGIGGPQNRDQFIHEASAELVRRLESRGVRVAA